MANGTTQNSQQGNGQKDKPALSWSTPASKVSEDKGQKPDQAGNDKKVPPRATPPVAPVGTSSSGRAVFIFLAGLIIGGLLTWSWFDLRSPSTPASAGTSSSSITSNLSASSSSTSVPPQGTSTSSGTPAGIVTSDSFTVPSPQAAGTLVTISDLSANDTVWAVVYEDNNGVPGRALGAARLTTAQTNGTIELLRATLPNLNYFVGLTADTPEHTFQIQTNAPILNQSGQRILVEFQAQ
ncbi:MAG: hypothetical protein KGJ34_01540 [Patescibacteria group bacterium]|nr:hypothetical protein [Patescibacteria group bacterium]